MRNIILSDLKDYLIASYPDLLVQLQSEHQIAHFLESKLTAIDPLLTSLVADKIPPYIIRAKCMEALLETLEPSKYEYVVAILEEEFEAEYTRITQMGVLTYEVMNIIIAAEDVFDYFHFNEADKSSRPMRYAIMGIMQELFHHSSSR